MLDNFEDIYEFDLIFKEIPDTYKEFIQILVNQTNICTIHRQELVRMLPVMFMRL